MRESTDHGVPTPQPTQIKLPRSQHFDIHPSSAWRRNSSESNIWWIRESKGPETYAEEDATNALTLHCLAKTSHFKRIRESHTKHDEREEEDRTILPTSSTSSAVVDSNVPFTTSSLIHNHIILTSSSLSSSSFLLVFFSSSSSSLHSTLLLTWAFVSRHISCTPQGSWSSHKICYTLVNPCLN